MDEGVNSSSDNILRVQTIKVIDDVDSQTSKEEKGGEGSSLCGGFSEDSSQSTVSNEKSDIQAEEREDQSPKKIRKRNLKIDSTQQAETKRTLRPRKKINYTEAKYSDYEVFTKSTSRELEEEDSKDKVKKVFPSQVEEDDEKTKELAKYFVIKKQYRSSFAGGVEESGLFPDTISKIEMKYLSREKFQVHPNDHSIGDIDKGFISSDCYLQLRNLLISLFYRNKTSHISLPRALKYIDERFEKELKFVYHFLEKFGYINFGVLKTGKTLQKRYEENKNNKTVIIVGGGTAGLSAARQLVAFGYKVIILEARSRLGGRTFSIPVPSSYEESLKFDHFKEEPICDEELDSQMKEEQFLHQTSLENNEVNKTVKEEKSEEEEAYIDAGAMVITGQYGNPVYLLCKQANIDVHPIGAECPIYNPFGQLLDPVIDTVVENQFNEILEVSNIYREYCAHQQIDATLGEVLHRYHSSLSSSVPPADDSNVGGLSKELSVGEEIENEVNQVGTVPPDFSKSANNNTLHSANTIDTDEKMPIENNNMPQKNKDLISSNEQLNLENNVEMTNLEDMNGTDISGLHLDFFYDDEDNNNNNKPVKQSDKEEKEEIIDERKRIERSVYNWHIANLEYGCACELEKVSLLHWDQDDEYEFSGQHFLLPKGYAKIVTALMDQLLPVPSIFPSRNPENYPSIYPFYSSFLSTLSLSANDLYLSTDSANFPSYPADNPLDSNFLPIDTSIVNSQDSNSFTQSNTMDVNDIHVKDEINVHNFPFVKAEPHSPSIYNSFSHSPSSEFNQPLCSNTHNNSNDMNTDVDFMNNFSGDSFFYETNTNTNNNNNNNNIHTNQNNIQNEEKKRGRKRKVRELKGEEIEYCKIFIQSPVSKIQYRRTTRVKSEEKRNLNNNNGQDSQDNEKEVAVYCTNGEVYYGDLVLITVPLGVLKSQMIEFEPKLPDWKCSAIERLGFGLLNKVVLHFASVFWPPDIDYFGHCSDLPSKKGEFFLFWNIERYSKKPILVALMAGYSAHEVEETPDNVIIQNAVSVLSAMFPSPSPLLYSHVTRWKNDQYARGSYSYIAYGSTGDDYDLIAEPIEKKVFFGGEATNRHHPATVAGAILSGIREAGRIHQLLFPLLPKHLSSTTSSTTSAYSSPQKRKRRPFPTSSSNSLSSVHPKEEDQSNNFSKRRKHFIKRNVKGDRSEASSSLGSFPSSSFLFSPFVSFSALPTTDLDALASSSFLTPSSHSQHFIPSHIKFEIIEFIYDHMKKMIDERIANELNYPIISQTILNQLIDENMLDFTLSRTHLLPIDLPIISNCVDAYLALHNLL